jgi:hypothetical protein
MLLPDLLYNKISMKHTACICSQSMGQTLAMHAMVCLSRVPLKVMHCIAVKLQHVFSIAHAQAVVKVSDALALHRPRKLSMPWGSAVRRCLAPWNGALCRPRDGPALQRARYVAVVLATDGFCKLLEGPRWLAGSCSFTYILRTYAPGTDAICYLLGGHSIRGWYSRKRN